MTDEMINQLFANQELNTLAVIVCTTIIVSISVTVGVMIYVAIVSKEKNGSLSAEFWMVYMVISVCLLISIYYTAYTTNKIILIHETINSGKYITFQDRPKVKLEDTESPDTKVIVLPDGEKVEVKVFPKKEGLSDSGYYLETTKNGFVLRRDFKY